MEIGKPDVDHDVPESAIDRRSGLRFTIKGTDASVKLELTHNKVIAGGLKNIGISGGMMLVEESVFRTHEQEILNALDTTKDLKLSFDNYEQIRPVANVTFCERFENYMAIGLYFKYPITVWSLREISSKLSLNSNYQARSHLFANQKDLALADMQYLHQAVNSLKSQQFNMVVVGIPIFTGLVMPSLVAIYKNELIPWWNILLPLVTLLLSVGVLAIFLQKSASIRRKDAFCHTLQTHLSLGCFPYSYRGWHDAYANYNHLVRFGGDKKYDVPIVPTVNFTVAPTDKFSVISIMLLLILPATAGVEILYMAINKMVLGSLAYMFIGMATAILLVATYWFFWKSFKKSRAGEDSYRALLIRFDKILHYAPPFNPCSKEPLS